jgi:uncharacterized membrane protein YraQ (UPF0718 family)
LLYDYITKRIKIVEYIVEFLNALIDLSNAMAPYILLGLIIAGILHEVVPDSIVKNHLGKDSFWSVIKATLFGIPLPVCSCGVIPLARSIQKSGASKGATLSFLISTPITGVDSILATYGIFGWIFTLYRVVTSLIISMVAGILSNLYAVDDDIQKNPTGFASKPSTFSPVAVQKPVLTSVNFGNKKPEKKKFNFKKMISYSFGTLLKDIASPLLLGLVLGALITTAVPKNLSEILLDYSWLSYIIAIAIAVPMYVCATASLPIAAGLILAGVSPGAAFVFLSAGPATNTVTIGVVKKSLGNNALYIYLGSIIIGSIIFGVGLDYIFKGVDVKDFVNISDNSNLLTILSSVILWVFVLYYIIASKIGNKTKTCSV